MRALDGVVRFRAVLCTDIPQAEAFVVTAGPENVLNNRRVENLARTPSLNHQDGRTTHCACALQKQAEAIPRCADATQHPQRHQCDQ